MHDMCGSSAAPTNYVPDDTSYSISYKDHYLSYRSYALSYMYYSMDHHCTWLCLYTYPVVYHYTGIVTGMLLQLVSCSLTYVMMPGSVCTSSDTAVMIFHAWCRTSMVILLYMYCMSKGTRPTSYCMMWTSMDRYS